MCIYIYILYLVSIILALTPFRIEKHVVFPLKRALMHQQAASDQLLQRLQHTKGAN